MFLDAYKVISLNKLCNYLSTKYMFAFNIYPSLSFVSLFLSLHFSVGCTYINNMEQMDDAIFSHIKEHGKFSSSAKLFAFFVQAVPSDSLWKDQISSHPSYRNNVLSQGQQCP